MGELLRMQFLFAETSLRLFAHINNIGMKWKYGECWRSDEQAEINAIGERGRTQVASLIANQFPALSDKILNNSKASGIRNSVHQISLAVDVNLFTKEGEWLSTTDAHAPIGLWWEQQNTLCRWGGRFGDGNHYSFEFEGRK